MNLRWSWDVPSQELFKAVNPRVWEQTGDPLAVLSELSSQRIAELVADHGFVTWVREREQALDSYLTSNKWFHTDSANTDSHIRGIAYFSPEFGVTTVLPQYSGGLGILAGDHLKSASDLGVPIIGIGLFYRSGYFRQSLSRDGWQVETYPVSSPDQSPVRLLRENDGSPTLIALSLPNQRTLQAQVWVANVGAVPLLLLDSDIDSNDDSARAVTDRLYGGGSETRLEQEMLLGIGGVRALRAFCRLTGSVEPNVFHTNEGHAGFLGVERIREFVQGPTRLSFEAALEASRANTVFTTHTPVPAGIDRFSINLIAQYFGGECAIEGVPVEKIIALGAESHGDLFNMAIMGFRLAGRANGVSLLHGEVSRKMFADLWPGFDERDVPITSITNGVHAPTWVSQQIFDLAQQQFGDSDPHSMWDHMEKLPDEQIWQAKRVMRERLVHMARGRLRDSWRDRGVMDSELTWVDSALDPDILTIGFARRVPSYKRLTLMLRDPARLTALLTDPIKPIQMVIAGKSHPADDGGKSLIQQLVHFADNAQVRHRIIFLPNYDIGMAKELYPGCDVWLNNPVRPLEASGTSGMKAALNGGLNLSIMDGWWDEWYDGRNGWAIASASGVDNDDRRDDLEAQALYDLIENTVAPMFYRRGEDGLPHDWLSMVRHTFQHLGPKVLATRMVRDYVEKLYSPAALAGNELSHDSYALADDLAHWKSWVRGSWHGVKVEYVDSEGIDGSASQGSEITIRAYLSLGELQPDDVSVNVVSGRVDSTDHVLNPARTIMRPIEQLEGNRWIFSAQILLHENGPFGFTVRVTPQHAGLVGDNDLGLQVVPEASSGFTAGDLPLR